MKLEPGSAVAKPSARQLRLPDGDLALLDVLLRLSALIIKSNYPRAQSQPMLSSGVSLPMAEADEGLPNHPF